MASATQIGSFTNFPQGFANGLSIRGMPLLQMQPGQVFFVGNGPVLNPNQKAGSDSNRGTFLDPFATLNYAVNTACVQGRGDIVFVLPGHRETIANATTLILGVAGVAIIGLGAGSSRPTLTFTTATTASIPLRATDVSLQNILFVANFADIASVFSPSATSGAGGTISSTTFTAAAGSNYYPGATLMGTGVASGTIILSQLTGTTGGTGTYQVNISQTVASTTITTGTHNFAVDNCEFRDSSSVLNFVALANIATGINQSMNGLNLTNNRIYSLGTTAATTAVTLDSTVDRVNVSNNFGNWAVLNDTPALLNFAAAATNIAIGGNRLYKPNTSSTGGSFVTLAANSTGHAYDNYLWQVDGTAGIWINTGSGIGFSNNFSPITGATDKSGLINPAAA